MLEKTEKSQSPDWVGSWNACGAAHGAFLWGKHPIFKPALLLLLAALFWPGSAIAQPQNQSWSAWTSGIYRNRPVRIRSPNFGNGWCLNRGKSAGNGGTIYRLPCASTPSYNYGAMTWIFRWRYPGETGVPTWWPEFGDHLPMEEDKFAIEGWKYGAYPYPSSCGSEQVCGYKNHLPGVNGYCMNMPNASLQSGTDAQMYQCVGAANERMEELYIFMQNPPVMQRMLRWSHSQLCWNQEPDYPNGNGRFQQYSCQLPQTANEVFEFSYWKCDLPGTSCSSSNPSTCCSNTCIFGGCG